MLKLQKSKDRQITLGLREKERFFSSLFLKAFLFALAIHAGAFLLFRIQPFKMDSTFLFPPVQVQSEAFPFPQATVAEESEESSPRFPIALFHPSPLLAKQTIPLEIAQIDVQVPFEKLERRALTLLPSPPSSLATRPSIQIIVSGPLSQKTLIEEAKRTLEEGLPANGSTPSHEQIIYQVQIEDKTGRIFWYNKMRGSLKPEVERAIETLLLDLRFEAEDRIGFTAGQIDFLVTSYD